MASYTVLYNPLAGNGSGYKMAKSLRKKMKGETLHYQDFTRILDYEDFMANLPEDERIIVCGGDGTLNRFINYTGGAKIGRDIFYCPGGSGNDFMKDLDEPQNGFPVCINKYVANLPYATVKGKKYYFQNGIGIGLDGYCCEVGEQSRGRSTRPINYTKIAIEGILLHFKPCNAVITVDGNTEHYKNVWISAVMKGRYFGGGMMPTPNQDRLNPENTVSVMVIHNLGKLKLLTLLPTVFKGNHIEHTKNVAILSGHEIKIEYDCQSTVQIDGEVIPGVTAFDVVSR